MSVFNDKLIASSQGHTDLFVYSHDGQFQLLNITTNDTLIDATWTPRGNIVYTTFSKLVVWLPGTGGNTRITRTGDCSFLSMSNDTIYLADSETGVYYSTDDGLSWNHVFNSTDGWSIWQVIKVTYNHNVAFWALEYHKSSVINRLHEYSVVKESVANNTTWNNLKITTNYSKARDINITKPDGKRINLKASTLAYDGSTKVFLLENIGETIHVFSVSGLYYCQLRLVNHHKDSDFLDPFRLTVNNKRRLLYVGHYNRRVSVFKLTYGHGEEDDLKCYYWFKL